MIAKTALEIQDTDILVIQDGEDTKQVSIADLKEYLCESLNINTKKIINQTIDNIIASLQATKYVVSVLRTFMINSWIGSTSGNIQMSIKDIDNDKWLTVDEIIALTNQKFSWLQLFNYFYKISYFTSYKFTTIINSYLFII